MKWFKGEKVRGLLNEIKVFQWFNEWNIRVKLLSGFIVVAIMAGLVGGIGILNIRDVDRNGTNLYKHNTVPMTNLGKASTLFQQTIVNLLFSTQRNIDTGTYISNINIYDQDINKALENYEKQITSKEELDELSNLKKSLNAYRESRKSVIDLVKGQTTGPKDEESVESQNAKKEEAVSAIIGQLSMQSMDINDAFDRLFQLAEKNAKGKADNITATTNRSVMIMIVIIAAGVLLALSLGVILSRAISIPVGKMVLAAESIAAGKLDVDVDIYTKDEVGILAGAYRKMIRAIKALVTDADDLTRAAVEGKLSVRADVSKHSGDFKKVMNGMNNTLNAVITPLNEASDYISRIANGEKLEAVENHYMGDFAVLMGNLNLVRESLAFLVDEANRLTVAASEGQLWERGDLAKLKGSYAEIVRGINNTLDGVVAPLDEAKEVLAKVGNNDFTVNMEGQYKGALYELGESVNAVIARLVSLQDAVVRISQGDTSRLDEFVRIGKRSENDQLLPSLIAMNQAIRSLIEEVNLLTDAAVNGDLNIRGDAGKLEGGYKEIIDGFNQTLDTVVAPIREASNVLGEAAKGNLAVSMKGDYRGIYGKIRDDINFTVKSIKDVLEDINIASEQVAAGSRQLSDSSQMLSHGSTEQAGSIEELTTAMAEIAAQTRQNAVNANQAKELAVQVKDMAMEGNEQMKEMLTAMNEINLSSTNISKIIKVIDEIAFQTNILSLNAAIEAARAGQQGKSFAVVAEEVRNLAARSANAAKETAQLIEGSIEKAAYGSRITQETADGLARMVDGVAGTAVLVENIALASNEQATAIAQVNQGITQVSQVTQTNSATAEESAAASEELSGQAELLKENVNKFKLRDNDELEPEFIHNPEKKEVRRLYKDAVQDGKGEAAVSRIKISLSDDEFGKY